MSKLRFSGHESFQCRNLWLKKGYDFIKENEEANFNDDTAVISLGVGKNMTTAIRYWLDAFGIRNDDNKDETSNRGNKLLANDGWDPYLEDIGSLWLLHYLIVSRNRASIYYLVFNRFRKHRIEFTKDHLISFLLNHCEDEGESHSPNTIETDVGVLLKTYVRPKSKEGETNIEDLFSSLLIELNLIKEIENTGAGKEDKWYKIESSDQDSLPIEIFFYSILDNIEKENFTNSISLHKLLNTDNSPGNIFALHPDALVAKLDQLMNKYDGISYKEDGGIRELQIHKEYSKENILDNYYARNE
ncbi:MAG: DUF4007 family protein [Pseudomonadota bacterium]|nr:DUF4007 family protein [Pseudomonadota bacterium]